MIRTGLVSITFRELQPEKITALTVRAGLAGIEWGGDIHVPHGDTVRARAVRRMTADSGLSVAAYGSYYRVAGVNDFSFEAAVETAAELGAPTIRVWAGEKNTSSETATADYRRKVADELRSAAEKAARSGMTVSCEFHGGTLTDTNESARRLMEETGAPGAGTYWQPPVGRDTEYCLAGLKGILPWLTNIHVFHWEGRDRRLLSEGAAPWRLYLGTVAAAGGEHYALVEFVRDGDPENFLRDAQTLSGLVSEAQRA